MSTRRKADDPLALLVPDDDDLGFGSLDEFDALMGRARQRRRAPAASVRHAATHRRTLALAEEWLIAEGEEVGVLGLVPMPFPPSVIPAGGKQLMIAAQAQVPLAGPWRLAIPGDLLVEDLQFGANTVFVGWGAVPGAAFVNAPGVAPVNLIPIEAPCLPLGVLARLCVSNPTEHHRSLDATLWGYPMRGEGQLSPRQARALEYVSAEIYRAGLELGPVDARLNDERRRMIAELQKLFGFVPNAVPDAETWSALRMLGELRERLQLVEADYNCERETAAQLREKVAQLSAVVDKLGAPCVVLSRSPAELDREATARHIEARAQLENEPDDAQWQTPSWES